MKRVRVRFALIGALLLVLVALLVHRAERSIEVERIARHDAVAERLFDEIERELSALLEEAETRDPGAYLGAPSLAMREFVLGLFELHPDGRLETYPLVPSSGADNAERFERLRRLTRAATQSEVDKKLGRQGGAQKEAKAQRAGSTQNLKQTPQTSGRFDDKGDGYSAYDALQSLNRSVQRRVGRKDESRAFEIDADLEEREKRGYRANGASSTALEETLVSALKRRTPMQSRTLDADHLMLFRTLVRDGRATRQGLWIDTSGFVAWLQEGVLSASSVHGFATLHVHGPFDADPALPSSEFVYRHRFAEPFDELRATLTLKALPGLGGAGYTRALSLLLVVVALAGLFALYRMVEVAFRFAERRSNFVAAVSHELKTPLTAIRMYAEMLRDDLVSDEAKRREYYRSITNESERLSRLIDNVLEFSKLEKGRHELALIVGSVEPVIREVERLLAAHVKNAGFDLAIEIDAGLPAVQFDRDALIQVLFNLVDNALKYAKEAETRRVTLQCSRTSNGVSISVRDFGPGLAVAELGKVFEPFYRSGPELTRRARGTGIGLALVRSLGEAMGATVVAENAEPAGLRVSLVLPSG